MYLQLFICLGLFVELLAVCLWISQPTTLFFAPLLLSRKNFTCLIKT